MSERQTPWSVGLLALTSAVLAWQMFAFIGDHAVNILFWDLWDVYPGTLFKETSWWEVVRHQVGKTRQGPGFLLTRLVAERTSMNTRAESFVIGGVFCLALVAAILLARRFRGRFEPTDAILPLIVLSSVQQDTWVGVPNLSVGAAPLLFIFLLCVSWTIRRPPMRVAAVIFFNALLVNSGYGLIAGPLAPSLFTVELVRAVRRRERARSGWAAAGLAGSLLAIVIFLHGWILSFGGECPGSSRMDLLMLPGFVVLMFGKFVGFDFDHAGLFATLVGTLLFFVMLEVLIRRGIELLRSETGDMPLNRVVMTLVGFSMLYAFLTAYGRICESLLVSQASRYMTFLIPGFTGLYLDIMARPAFRWRRPALALLVAGALLGAFSVRLVTDDGAARISDSKRRWRDCYLRTEDVGLCDSETRARVYPWDTEIVLPPKLLYLKENRLNLYAEP